jgi:hypothetical protein
VKLVAVEGMTIEYTVGSVVASATEVLGPASLNVSVDGNGVYAGSLSISVTKATDGSGASAGTGAGVFVPSSSYCTADGEKLLLEGDEATIEVTGTKGSQTYAWTLTAKIKSAGQDSVSAE